MAETKRSLEKIWNRCKTCHRISNLSIQSRVVVPCVENLDFRDDLSIDFAFLGEKAVFRIVDIATRVSTDKYFDFNWDFYSQSVEDI